MIIYKATNIKNGMCYIGKSHNSESRDRIRKSLKEYYKRKKDKQ